MGASGGRRRGRDRAIGLRRVHEFVRGGVRPRKAETRGEPTAPVFWHPWNPDFKGAIKRDRSSRPFATVDGIKIEIRIESQANEREDRDMPLQLGTATNRSIS